MREAVGDFGGGVKAWLQLGCCGPACLGVASVCRRRTLLTISIDDTIEVRLRERAAASGRSPEDEAREVLGTALLACDTAEQNLGQALHEEFAKLGGVELDLGWLRKLPALEPPSFD